jgi:hypothetical protein
MMLASDAIGVPKPPMFNPTIKSFRSVENSESSIAVGTLKRT